MMIVLTKHIFQNNNIKSRSLAPDSINTYAPTIECFQNFFHRSSFMISQCFFSYFWILCGPPIQGTLISAAATLKLFVYIKTIIKILIWLADYIGIKLDSANCKHSSIWLETQGFQINHSMYSHGFILIQVHSATSSGVLCNLVHTS